jgi:hypothetical protein
MNKRARNLGSHSPPLNSKKPKDASRKRARVVGSNGRGFAERIRKGMEERVDGSMDGRVSESMDEEVDESVDKPEIFTISDSSDEEVSRNVHQGKGGSRSDISLSGPSPIGESGAKNSSPLGHKSAERDLGAKNLAAEYDPGRPDFENEAELEQTTGSQSGEETREGGSCAMQCLAVAEKDSDLQLEEVRKRINQDTIQERELLRKLIDIRLAMGILEDSGL